MVLGILGCLWNSGDLVWSPWWMKLSQISAALCLQLFLWFCISQLELWQLISAFDLCGDLACMHCWEPSFSCSLFTLLNSGYFLQILSCSLCYLIKDDCWYHSSGEMVWQGWNVLSPPSSLVLVSIHELAPLPSGVYKSSSSREAVHFSSVLHHRNWTACYKSVD